MSSMEERPGPEKNYMIYRLDSNGREGYFTLYESLEMFPKSPWLHALHYATAVFEGILAVRSERQEDVVNILTLDENIDRLIGSMQSKLFAPGTDGHEAHDRFQEINPRIELLDPVKPVYLQVNAKNLEQAIIKTILENLRTQAIVSDEDNKLIYIRPVAYRGEAYDAHGIPMPRLGVASLQHEVCLEISAVNVKPYLESGGKKHYPRVLVWEGKYREKGVTSPARHIKGADNYGFAGIAKCEAMRNGFHETLLLDSTGEYALEGGGENLFMVKDGVLVTPPLEQSILPGTKRGVVLKIARLAGIPCEERPIHLEELFSADAMAFSGTWMGFDAVEVLYRNSDGRTKEFPVNHEVVRRIRQIYNDIIHDRVPEPGFGELQRIILHPVKLTP